MVIPRKCVVKPLVPVIVRPETIQPNRSTAVAESGALLFPDLDGARWIPYGGYINLDVESALRMLGLVLYETAGGRSPVQDYLERQTDTDRALLVEKVKAFCEEFPILLTVNTKPLRGKVWEIRVAGATGLQHRLLYRVVGQDLVIVHAFTKKSRKTPPRELQLAERRLKEMTR
jgi:phage-related protein